MLNLCLLRGRRSCPQQVQSSGTGAMEYSCLNKSLLVDMVNLSATKCANSQGSSGGNKRGKVSLIYVDNRCYLAVH